MRRFSRTVLFGVVVAIAGGFSGDAVQAASDDLAAKLRLCRDTYVMFWLPLFGEDRDYCDVKEQHGDVSNDRGVQWDVIKVIDRVGRSLERHREFRALAKDLAQCVESYPAGGRASRKHPDWCNVSPRKDTLEYFMFAKTAYTGIANRFSLPDVLEAAWRAVKRHGRSPMTFQDAAFVVRATTGSRVIHVSRYGRVFYVTVSVPGGKQTLCVVASTGAYLGPC